MSLKSGKKDPTKHFLTLEEKKSIQLLYSYGHTKEYIAKFLTLKERQVSSYIERFMKDQTNKFTDDEVNIIIKLYQQGITKESIIAKTLKTKAPWMIRNKIKVLKREKKLELPIVSKDVSIENNEYDMMNFDECVFDL